LEWQEVAAGAGLRDVLEAARAARVAAGWQCGEISMIPLFFAERGGERVQVAIEQFHPDDPGPMHCDPKPC
jgi:hypothetical protein